MRKKEDQGYRNPAYIYNEGQSGGGPDSRSASSTSSKSSMNIIGTKCKRQSRRRWITLTLIIFIAIVVIIAVTTAIYFTRNSKQGSPSKPDEDVHDDGTGANASNTTTDALPTDDPVTTTISKIISTIQTTTQSSTNTTNATTTTHPTTAETTITHQTAKPATTITTTTTTATTTTTTSTATTTTALPTATRTRSPTTQTTTTIVTSDKPTTSSIPPYTRSPNTTTTELVTDIIAPTAQTTTQRKQNVSTPVTAETTTGKPTNLTVTMSDILYHPDEVKTVTLMCQGRHHGNWRTVTIRRQFKDSFEPVAVAVYNDEKQVEVFKFYPNVSHVIHIAEYDVTLTLTFDPFLCAELTNFTCSIANAEETVSSSANISIYMPEPEIDIPHAIVEDRVVTLQCITEVWGSSATLLWKFKPANNLKFMDFSVAPINNFTRKNCTTVINSTLVFNPTMYEDGAEFRCQIIDKLYHPQVIQTPISEVTLKVVPSNYCDGKRQFTIHPHPHGPCTLVVYCLDTGPLVYEIECEPGHCYDYIKTACVPADTGV